MKNIIDPKNPHTVGKSAWNLGNHILMICFVLAILFVIKASYAEDSFENTIKKIEMLEGNNSKVEYDKILPLKDQYCFIKVTIKQVGDEVVKEEILECADGRKKGGGPTYWELFADFYYADLNTPVYCRKYDRGNHAFKSFGTVCLTENGKWEVK